MFPAFEIPVAANDTLVVYSLLESIVIQKNMISGWFKFKSINVSPVIDENGDQLVINGSPITKFEFDKAKGYSLSEYKFDCEKNQQRINRDISYEEMGNPKKDTTFTNEQSPFQSPIPRSLGELLQKFACSLK